MNDSEAKQFDNNDVHNQRLNNILKTLAKCKNDFLSENSDSKKIKEINSKLELELKEARELEKSHRYHLMSSREMIGNLQETVSQLVHLKRDIKKLKEEILSRDNTIAAIEKDKENLAQKHSDNITELRNSHERLIEELTVINERKLQQVQHECDTKTAQFSCVIEELQSKIKEMENENRDKMNLIVLEYEEKIQRGASQVLQLQEQLARQAARTDSNIDAYKRRLEELEEKLKQSEFKQYLAQSSYRSQYESQVERPYSVNDDYNHKDSYPSLAHAQLDVPERSQPKLTPIPKAHKPSALQVMYYDKTPKPEQNKKGQFNISKKRKLYNDKDFQDF